ncbi:M48 family metallopeptidase [Acinetobacter shaoyimingii]|uniref:M48 family metallopeptidase n=1 Tax=Acinetobacter shaoyimingii TaxID=2715164 RepID=A0A6G8RVS3_9GAMM|nr:SprT family zinc-dependent metalloprotease [Acinetobacter shaoyimingii]QIO06036.1 M48 family metallopeptidase [Acinetobacter shaoyimingii]
MTLSDLPEIQITRNIRSTRLRLRVEPTQIKVTAPIFCTQGQIQNFIQQSEQWLIQTWQKQQAQMVNIDRTLPSELNIFDLVQPLKIIYRTQKKSYDWDQSQNLLMISDRAPEQYLKAFVIAYAKQALPAYLAQVSAECDLLFKLCSIRQPKTRWGSCNARHDIMLNSALVLYPKEITRYVCVHELVHTRHFDHSTSFWNLVEKYDPNYKANRKQLKQKPLPYWWN